MKKTFFRGPTAILSSLLLIALLTTALWLGCGQQTPTAPEQEQEVLLGANEPQALATLQVQERHTNDLMARPGVVGVGTGLTDDGRPAIVVLVETKEKALAANIPAAFDETPVKMIVTGKIRALKGPPGGGGGVDPTARFDRPVPIGVSTGHPDITAGTIGCRVTAGSNVFALSNNHVYANENLASIGDDVIQPGTFDGGSLPDDFIGTLSDFEPIVFSTSANNVIDAAIASTTTSLLGNSTPSDGYGTPKTLTIAAAVNMRVMKYGRTTGQTKGRVQAINATVNVGYDTGVARFVNQIVIGGGGFSSGGDSGSLIVVQKGSDARRPVGLLFAGGGGTTIANPIDAVLDAFNVTIDGE